MSRTRKDTKKYKQYDNWHVSFKPGTKKWWRRMSNKKIRQTPITRTVVDMEYSEEEITLRIPRNIVKGGIPQDATVNVTITVAKPKYIEVENHPRGLDIWTLD